MVEKQQNGRADETLDSWKSIANYLQRRVRTVQRWERDEGLPVRRHQHKKQATVYAYKHELDAWRAGRVQAAAGSNRPKTRFFALIAAALVAIALGLWATRTDEPREYAAQKMLLVVLPFDNLSPDPTLELLGDGLTEELSTQLAKLKPAELGVIARTSAMSYKGRKIPVDVIRDELIVDYVLEGSIRQEHDTVRVTVQLIETERQSHVWAESYDHDFRAWLELQEKVAADVLRDLGIALKISNGNDLDFVNRNVTAYEQVLKAQQYFGQWGPGEVPKAIEHFNRAIEIDGEYTDAYLGLALSYSTLAFFRVIPKKDGYGQARSAAAMALKLDPSSGEAHAFLGWIQFAYDWDWEGAENHMRRGIELSPNSPWVHWMYGNYLSALDRGARAAEHMRIAHRLDPLSQYTNVALGYVLANSGLIDEGIAQLKYANEIASGMPAQGFLISNYAMNGYFEEAISAIEEVNPERATTLKEAYQRDGAHGYWQVTRDRLEGVLLERPDFFSWFLAYVRAELGDIDGAIDMLEKGYYQRDGQMIFLLSYPLDPLYDDPRYHDLLRRMKLPASDSSENWKSLGPHTSSLSGIPE